MSVDCYIVGAGSGKSALLANFAQQNFSWFFAEESVVRDRLQDAEQQLPQQVPFAFGLTEVRTFKKDAPYLPLDALEPGRSFSLIIDVDPHTVETLDICYSRSARRLWESVKALRQRLALASMVIRIALAVAIFPLFLCFMERHDKIWHLLHGAHPPRLCPAGQRAAFAEFGRACRMARA